MTTVMVTVTTGPQEENNEELFSLFNHHDFDNIQ